MSKGEIEKILKEQQLKNIQEVREHINDKEYDLKINNLIKLFDGKLTREQIYQEVYNSDIAALHLSKDAKKQNLVETHVLNKLKEINPTFIKLPPNGKDSIRFTPEGKLIYGCKNKTVFKDSKSVDYYSEINGRKWYYAQKYTTGEGGAQDNQYKDAITFIDNGLKNENRDFGIGLILDGDYYHNKDRIDNLKNEYNNKPNCIVISLETISQEEINFLKGDKNESL